MNQPALILYNKLSKHPSDDELDVLEQVAIVRKALKELGFEVKTGQVDLNLQKTLHQIKKINPCFIFNLVETINNLGEFVYFPAAIYHSLNIPFSGSPLIPLFFAANKVRAKIEMKRLGVPTPSWFEMDALHLLNPNKKYILKPIWEEGSLGLDEDCVFNGNDLEFIENIRKKSKEYYFVEEFVEGREFNISILAGPRGPEVLPFAEMHFIDYPEGKPKIMGYTAKWKEDSFEYLNTRRTFEIKELDQAVYKKMLHICNKCWNKLGLKGYVRLDFRIDLQGNPYVIDINANPCLSGSGGFMAASKRAGLKPRDIIQRIVEHALGNSLPLNKKHSEKMSPEPVKS
ncbi:MAG: ATP-grasp domain-containing protein [Bacteroidales bacterium]|nr:ATP-grasp domain-containing protein [Bacteroidales bacterium]